MTLSKSQLIDWLNGCNQLFNEQHQYLTDLDTAIGDADHGLNMQRGFQKVAEKLPSVSDKDIGTILKTTGMTLLSSIGGASGPLFGTLFIKAATAVQGKETLNEEDIYQLFKQGVDGLVARGKAELGDKTMCDVWLPVITSMSLSINENKSMSEMIKQAVLCAKRGVESTINLQARKGRASYLGERSLGHQDPGATSAMLIIQALSDVINKSE